MTNPNCKLCEGKGWYWVPNGPDDVDKEPCDCTLAHQEECDCCDYMRKDVEPGGMPNNEIGG